MIKEREVYEDFAQNFIQKVYDPTMQNMYSLIDKGIGHLSTIEALDKLTKEDKESVKYICSQVIELALGNALNQLKEHYYDEKIKILISKDEHEYDVIKIAQQHTYGHIDGEFYIEGGWIDRYSKLINKYRYFHVDRSISPIAEWWIEENDKKIIDEPKTKAEWIEYEKEHSSKEVKKKEIIENYGMEKINYYTLKNRIFFCNKEVQRKDIKSFINSLSFLEALYLEKFDSYKEEVEFLRKGSKENKLMFVIKALEPICSDYTSRLLNDERFPMFHESIMQLNELDWFSNVLNELELLVSDDINDTINLISYVKLYEACLLNSKIQGNEIAIKKYVKLKLFYSNLMMISVRK